MMFGGGDERRFGTRRRLLVCSSCVCIKNMNSPSMPSMKLLFFLHKVGCSSGTTRNSHTSCGCLRCPTNQRRPLLSLPLQPQILLHLYVLLLAILRICTCLYALTIFTTPNDLFWSMSRASRRRCGSMETKKRRRWHYVHGIRPRKEEGKLFTNALAHVAKWGFS